MTQFLEELKNKGVNAEVITEPANSSDTNLLDLGFFMQCNLQMMKYPTYPTNLCSLSEAKYQ